MVKEAPDLYGDFGSVPQRPDAVTPPSGSGAGPLSVRATPEMAGAQAGKGIENVGNAAEQVANLYGGMVLETAANQAELSYIKASGDLKSKYSKYEGLQAEAMRPQYEAELQNLHQQYRGNLPLGAQRMFDSNTIRSLGYQTSEYAQYAAGQVKQANLSSNDALADASIAKAGNLPTVTNPTEFGETNATIVHAANAVADIKGWASLATGTDKDTGKLTFGDDPQSQATKSQYEQYLAEKQSKLYLTAAKTVADNHGAAAAADWAQAHWNLMPDAAKVQMNQFLAPKMKNEVISGNIAIQNQKLDEDWNKQLTSNVPGSPLEQPQKTPLDVIRQNEGYTGKIGRDSNGANVINGINEKAFPAEYAEAKRLLETQGKAAADKYADDFYQKNIIDKYDIKSLPANTQAIVADGLVNHGTGDFGKSLIDAAKNGATPQQLIDMRRSEYQRLATSDTDGSRGYAASLKGWNARLDGLQGQAFQSYPNKADFLRSREDDYVSSAFNSYLQQYPDDYYGAQIQERRAKTDIQRQIAMEDAKLKSDRDIINNAIGGGYTKGVPPTLQQIQAMPNMQPILDRTMREQGEFFGTIDTMIAKASHHDLSENSTNGYDAITRTLLDSDSPNAIRSEDHLSKLLGDNRGTGITWKDFQDAKPALDLDSRAKEILRNHMKDIATANGNVDGQGQTRAVQWYNQTMDAYKKNEALGDKKDSDFWENVGDSVAPPSRMQQIENWAKSYFGKKEETAIPTLTDKAQFDELPSGSLYIRDGQQYRKP